MRNSWQVATAAEAFAAAQFARCGWNVSVQYGANQPEYDLVAADGDRLLKVSVKGSQDGSWGLTQSFLKDANYQKAANLWLAKHGRRTVICLVQFKDTTIDSVPRMYLATPREIADWLKAAAGGRGDTILYERHEWSSRARAAGTIDVIPDSWRFTEGRLDEMLEGAGAQTGWCPGCDRVLWGEFEPLLDAPSEPADENVKLLARWPKFPDVPRTNVTIQGHTHLPLLLTRMFGDSQRFNDTIHGAPHWVSTLDNACRLLSAENVTGKVALWVRLAALLHDVGRLAEGEGDGDDETHAMESESFVRKHSHELFPTLAEPGVSIIALLVKGHRIEDPRDEATLAALGLGKALTIVRDADRLDRVRMNDLDPAYLELASSRGLIPYCDTKWQVGVRQGRRC